MPRNKQISLRTCCQTALVMMTLSFSAIIATPSAVAQSVQGTVLGSVRDPQGAVVPGATVTLTSETEGVTRTTTTNAAGDFIFVDAKAGQYTVDVTRDGFDRATTSHVALASRQELRLNVALKIGNIQQDIVVSGDTVSAIETETASISAVYNRENVADLPVNNRAGASGTSALNIIGTLPGVQADHGAFSLQGGLPFQTEVAVDGITIQSATGNSPIADAFPSTESISEVRADGALNSAEFGQPGEVTITTKGGGNKLRGGIFWYHQNRALNAIPYTYPITTTKPKLIGNTFGASVGGPVFIPHFYDGRNKTFFFGAYEGWRFPSQTTQFFKVPSTLMKKGDFSKFTSAGFSKLTNPFTGGTYGTTIPTINSAAAQLLSLYPDPNIGDPTAFTDDGVANYQVNKDTSRHSDQFDIRVDKYLGANQKFLAWGRFTWKNFPTNSTEPLLVPAAQNTNKSRVLKLSGNYTITPHMINEAGFGYTLYTSGQTNSFDGTGFTNKLGLVGLQNLFYNGLPELDFGSISSLNADRLSSTSQSNTFVYTDNFNWTRGNHQIRVGLDIRALEAITALGFNGADNYGTFGFNTSKSASLFTGVDFADFLLGLPNQTFYDVVQQDNDGISNYYNFFAQDQWKVNKSLTLSYGLRYELHPGYYDPNGDIGNFDPAYGKSGAAIYPDGKESLLAKSFLSSANACSPYGLNTTSSANVNGAPCMPVLSNSAAGYPRGLKKYPHLRFMPRVGFAYRPFHDEKTVVRGGFGMYNITELGGSFYSLTGTLQAQTSQYANTLNTTTHAIGYQWPTIYAGAGNGGCNNCYGTSYFGTANSTVWKTPYTEQWSMSVDHDFGNGYAARVSYIGSNGRQLVWAPDENSLPFSSTVSANNAPLSSRLFPNWGRINTRATGANSTYNSLQIEASHRFQRGLQFSSAYTLAKGLSDNQGPNNTGFAGETGGGRATSILQRSADFGNVTGTRRHRWSSTMIYDLPVGRGRQFGTDMPRALDLLVGGWRVSNIFLWESGPYQTPYFPSGQGDPSGTGSGLNASKAGFDGGHRTQHVDVVQGVNQTPANRTRLNWVSAAAFTCPGYPNWVPGTACTTGSGSGPAPLPIGRFGNAPVGSVIGAGTINLSSGISKSFPITEGIRFRVEGTFTNVLNHTNLGDPNLNITSTTFGRISGTISADNGGARTGQVSARIDF